MRARMIPIFRFAIVAITVLTLGNTAHALSIKGNEITLRIGSGHPPFITYMKKMSKFFIPQVKARVGKETKYTIQFKEHYSGTVVTVFDTLEGVQDGRLDIGGWCVCFEDDKAMAMNFTFFVPFVETDAIKAGQTVRRVIKEFPELHQDYEGRYNQKFLAITGFSNQGLLTAFDWNKFEDLKGHKILGAGPTLSWIKGPIPVITTIPTASQQLQTGVGEGIVLTPDTVFKLKLHEAAGSKSVYTVTNFGTSVQVNMTMNLVIRKKLPKDVVRIIDEVALAWAEETSKTAQAEYVWGLEQLKKANVKIKTIDKAAQKAWALRLKDLPNERAQAVKAKKGIDLGRILRKYIEYTKAGGHQFPVDYVIK